MPALINVPKMKSNDPMTFKILYNEEEMNDLHRRMIFSVNDTYVHMSSSLLSINRFPHIRPM